jgi:hypothetical protein
MAAYIVETAGPNGARAYRVYEATSQNNAEQQARLTNEQDWFTNIVVNADAGGIATLRKDSPGFNTKFPEATWDSNKILNQFGVANPVTIDVGASTVETDVDFGSDIGTGNTGNNNNDFGDISADTGSPTEAFSFRPAFESGLRQSGIDVRGGGGVRGALANRAYDPLLSRATLSAAFNPLGGDYDPEATQESLMEGLTFQNYLKGQAAANSLYGTGGAQAARGLFEQARNLSGDPVAALKAMGEGGGISGQFLKPATIGQGTPLADVAREGGRQRFGSFARFLPSAQDLTQTYLSYAPETQGPQQQSFADFLNKRIFG